MPDQDFFDEVFRRASDEPDIPFNETAWTRMEQKLDREERKRFFWLWLRRSTLALLLFFSLIFLWSRFQKNKNTAAPEKPAVQTPADKHNDEGKNPGQVQTTPLDLSQTPISNTKDPRPENAGEPATQNPARAAENRAHNAPSKNGGELLPGQKQPTPDKSNTGDAKTGARSQNKGVRIPGRPTPAQPPQAVVLPPQPQTPAPAVSAAGISHSGGQNNPEADSSGQTEPAEHLTPPLTAFVFLAPVPLREVPIRPPAPELHFPVEQTPPALLPKPVRRPLAAVGIAFAPQITSVGFGDRSKGGYSLGLGGNWYFSPRWAVQSDLAWTKQHFIAGRGEYKAPYGFWKKKVSPFQTEGHTKMLEWALSARVDWLQQGRWRGFAHAGAVSWWVLSEECRYLYVEQDPYLTHWWKASAVQEHWFATARAGAGLGREILPGFEVQLEVFAQSPLKGIGNGKLDLYAQGVAVGIRKVFYKK